MSRPRILVVGSFVMDQIGTTKVFPREGQTVLGEGFTKAPGGKGANQAVQAARLGADVTWIGKLGRDSNGEAMLEVCKEAGIDTGKVLYDDNAASGCSLIIVEEKENNETANRILVIPGTNHKIRKEELKFLEDDIKNYDLLILQLEIPMEINCYVAKLAYDAGVPVMLNSAPSAPLPDELLACLTYISPNESEAEDLTGISIKHEGDYIDMDAVRKAAAFLRNKGVKNVLITLGSAGALIINDDGEFHSPCASGVKVADPTAAGDSFLGAFATAICSGTGLEEALTFANHAAGITVSRMGAMPALPTLEEVKAFMKERGK